MNEISTPPQDGAPTIVNENFAALAWAFVYAKNADTTTGLTWGYFGGRWGGFSVAASTHTLTDSATNYLVVAVATGVQSASTATTNWNDATNYRRTYKLTTSGGVVTATEDHRAGHGGVHSSPGAGAAGAAQAICIACSDETTALSTGTAKVTFHMPFNFTLTGDKVMAGLTTAQTSGSVFTVDINEAGSSILSTKITIDNTEETSLTAATAPVVSDSSLAKGAKITIDIDQIGDGTAAGLKVYLIGESS